MPKTIIADSDYSSTEQGAANSLHYDVMSCTCVSVGSFLFVSHICCQFFQGFTHIVIMEITTKHIKHGENRWYRY